MFDLILAMQDAAPSEDGSPGFGATLLVPMGIMFAVMWLFMIKPQKKMQLEREKMLGALKKNDHILTNGGIHGIVDRVSEHEVILKIDENKGVKIRMARSAVASVIKVAGGGKPEKEEEKS